jgi:hypothetical protein
VHQPCKHHLQLQSQFTKRSFMIIKKAVAVTLFTLPLMLFSGCASMTGPARKHVLQPNSPYWIDYDASRRGTLITPRPDGKGFGYCAEPSPDIAYQTVLSMVGSLQQSSTVDASLQLQFQQTVVELAQRTETIQFFREAMYRLCEQSMNGTLSQDQVKDLYDNALKAALALAEADLAKKQSTIVQGLQDPKVRALWEQFVGTPPPTTPANPATKLVAPPAPPAPPRPATQPSEK